MNKLVYIILLILLSSAAYSQLPYMQHFSPIDFQGAPQTWEAQQDENGLMYFANSNGILIYDGIDWELVPILNKALVEDICIDPAENKVYASGNGHIGYLESNEKGKLQYISLLNQIEEKYRNFKRVTTLTSYSNGVAFISDKTLYLYNRKQFYCYPVESGGRFFKLGNELFLRLFNDRYYRIKGNNIELVNIEDLLGVKKVFSACKFVDEDSYIIVSNGGLFISSDNGKKTEPYSIKGWDKKKHGVIYSVKPLQKDLFLFDLSLGGLLITDRYGNIKMFLNEAFGLPARLMNTFEDRDGHLWVLTENGISYIESGSPFAVYDKRHQLGESVLSLYYNEDDNFNYIGTSQGVFYISDENKIEPIEGKQINNQIWNFENIHERHLIASGYGVYELKDKKVNRIISQRWVHSLGRLKDRKDAFLLGTYADGLFAAIYENGKWRKQKVKGFNEEIRYIEDDGNGNIWISHYNKGIYKLKLSNELDTVIQADFYSKEHGLPSNENNRVFRLRNDELVIATVNGFYQFDPKTEKFIPHKVLNESLPLNFCIYTINENSSGDIWMWAAQLEPNKVELAAVLKKQNSGKYKLKKNIFYKIKKEIRGLAVDMDAPVLNRETYTLIGKAERLIIYEDNDNSGIKSSYKTLFKKVTFGDSVYLPIENDVANFDYELNDLKIDIAAPFFESVKDNTFRFKLEGYKDEWSAWSHNNTYHFTNLSEGDYELKAQAKNIYDEIAVTGTIKFTVNPPLSRRWYTYLFYIISVSLLIYVIVRWNTNRLREQKTKLEEIVADRTKELTAQTEELSQMNEEIQAQRNSLEISNRQLSTYNSQIRDSINAGKIIQDALLPFTTRIESIFDEHFILYEPKDIVSGDFYWLSQNEDEIFIAVIDCTGHGVPGAFMSLLAYSLLNEIVEINKITDPGKVLNKLHERVNYALANSRKYSKGGMDICFCKIVLNNSKMINVSYAGAKRPIYYIENNELKKIAGDRSSIGVIHNEERSFNTKEMTINKGSVLYLTTDGYVDIPSPERKKFGTKRLENLFTEMKNIPLEKQLIILQEKMEAHKQTADQRDDVTILGIKI